MHCRIRQICARVQESIRSIQLSRWVFLVGLLFWGTVPASAQVGVELPDTSGVAGETGTIPVRVDELTGKGVLSFEFTISYDADTLSVAGIETAETLASNLSVVANTEKEGEVSVSAGGTQELSGSGPLIELDVRYEAVGTTPLDWTSFQFNEGSPAADLTEGAVTVRQSVPVELASFRATFVGNESVRLTWVTARETNNARFEMQRRDERSSPTSWNTIGHIQGQGTTTERTDYQFTDETLPYDVDTLAYRLKQVDTDGTAQFSDRVVVERGSVDRLALMKPFPNPARGRVTIRYAVPETAVDGRNVRLRLYDVLGRTVHTAKLPFRAGRHERHLTVAGLPSGTYVLRLTDGEWTETRRLTVVQ